jgi:hypothetical protein
MFFGSVFGSDLAIVSAAAKAQVGVLSGSTGVLPFGVEVPATMFSFGALVCLKLASNGPCSGSGGGNFLAIDIDNTGNSGATTYEEDVRVGSSTVVNIGDVRAINTGAMAGPTRQGLGCVGHDGRLANNTETFADVVSDSGGVYEVRDWGSPRLALVPFVTSTTSTVTIQEFGVFFIDGCTGGGSSAAVQGRFIDVTKPGGRWAPLQSSNVAGGRATRLTQ